MDANNSSHVLYESFDYPTDTFLPGMKLGLFGNQNRLLTSWRNSSDPARGDFLFGANPNGTKQMFIWDENTVHWDSGVWDGKIFRMAPSMIPGQILYNYSSNAEGDEYFTYSMKNVFSLSRFVMNASGRIQQQIWHESSDQWRLFWSLPMPQCDVYNLCGDNCVCDEDSRQQCTCLPGFALEQTEPENSASNSLSKPSCKRKISLQCHSKGRQNGYLWVSHTAKDGFLAISRMGFPADPQHLAVGSPEECKFSCLNNCSCTAYAFSDGCLSWYGNLEDLKRVSDDSNSNVGDLYLRLSGSELRDGGRKNWIRVVATVTVLLGSFLSISIMCFCWRRKRRDKQKLNRERSILAAIQYKIDEHGERGAEFTLFDFSKIADATDNFSLANKLGEGGFGPVYKGKFSGGQEIAVKRLSTSSGQGLEEFKNEVILIAKLQHRNLVRLLGCCIQEGEKILVYEYMPHKSLDYFLFEPSRGAQLDWSKRLNIIFGIAHGLLYLHKHSRLRIIHRDLKASNILLDEEFCPKISDFGTARIFSSNETQAKTTRVVGTYGYMSPEYASKGIFSIKSDVFSFGVLLLEIVSGRRNAGFDQYGNSFNLLGHAWELWIEGKWFEIVDPVLEDTCQGSELCKCIHVALLCVQENASDRVTMSEVITMLYSENSEHTSLTTPKQPAFFDMRIKTEAYSQSIVGQKCSINEMTATAIHGR
ncbi:hypothetical protein J5N97_027189 [Dioscorea zingiberensis]|uniref:Receptor-like serine/threonine-protein kinase n=1 Tax=Dioscorea zingiberensis TaxID=325984 RepID=A0A9D5C3U3_9LILI|nr:hypothetical protein J5N97_027189 [Dioscorea zingiberensis]